MVTGSQTSFSANPDDGLPLMLGRTGTAGKIVYRTGFDTRDAGDNDRQSFVSVLSVGPIAAIEGQTVDQVPVSYTATGAAIGQYAGWMWSQTQRGTLPEGSPLGFGAGAGTPPGWGPTHKLSGKAAASWTLRFDTKGKMFQAGVPAPMWVGRGARCYDPTKDSTYPGGSGSHRMADPSDTAAYDAAQATWEWTENPYLLAMRWAHGVWQRDPSVAGSTYQRVMGIGAPWALIDVAAFVEGRNIAVANGWTAGGIVYSTDGKWDTMKRILQAGMGEPMALGARISCYVNAPKVSLATITTDDVVGAASVTATQSRRDRINTITPRYRLEANNWQYLPGSPISVAEHVALDGGKRSRLQDYPLIQNTKQVATAVRYDIENAREFGPIVLPLKLVWMGYKPGDCVTATLPELGLNAQPILLLQRQLAPASGVVTMTARSETPGKHAFALGQTTTPPPTPGVTAQPIVPMPRDFDWTLAALPAGGQLVTPTLAISGACAANVDGVVFEYRVFDSGAVWTAAGSDAPTATYREITGLRAGTAYEVAVSYTKAGVASDRRVIGPVTTAMVSVKGDPGADGLPGAPGADGRTTYTHYAYANSPDGVVDFVTGESGTRAYEGSYTDFSPTDSTSPGAYSWREYRGPPFGMATRGVAVVAGRQIIKNGGADDWDSDAYSTVGYLDGAVASARPGISSVNMMFGLNTDPLTDASYSSLDHAWYCTASQSLQIYESGSYVGEYGAWNTDTALQISYDGRFVRYLKDGAVRLTRDVGAGKLFYFDSSLNTTGSRWDAIEFSAAGTRGVDGRDGLDGSDGLPGAPGANGQTSYVHFAYADSADGQTNFTVGDAEGRTYIGTYTDFTPGDSGNPAAYVWTRLRGIDGANGIPGQPGEDGRPSYVHIAYANSADGQSDFDLSDPTGRRYIGVYTDQVLADSTSPAAYTWSLIKGADGAPGVSPLLVTAQPAALQLQGDTAGAAVPGSLPAYIENSASRAGVSATITGVTIDATSGCTASVAGDGTTIAITAISKATASVSYTVSAAGLSQQVKVGITVLRAPTSLEERGLNIGSGGTSTSYDVFGGTISIQAGSSGKIDTLLSGTYYSGGSGAIGETRLQTKHQYRVPSGSWVDVSGSEGMGSSATRANGGPGEPPENNPGSPYDAIGHITGLTAGTYYEVRALAYYDTSMGSTAKPATGVACVLIAKQVA
ncbi:hypothetical protein [Sphingomonas sp. CCH9-F2]|uniref:hypothetical protein n=1 Tax=Sphingomonas sp. CCH9-F2 TaxID=1768778 RepID=UPI00082C7E1E|nr:hypothetical protein [Sphingomonas sp. CCH9-F2]